MDFIKKVDKSSFLSSLMEKFSNAKNNPLTGLMGNPENYKLEAYIQGSDIVIKIKKRTSISDLKPTCPRIKPPIKRLPKRIP